MPYKHKFYKIKREDDRRIKLTDVEREEIRTLYGTISQRKLARIYGVSRRLIQFIGDPEKHEKNLVARRKRGGSKFYYDKDKHREYTKDHRHHKQKLYLEDCLEKP